MEKGLLKVPNHKITVDALFDLDQQAKKDKAAEMICYYCKR